MPNKIKELRQAMNGMLAQFARAYSIANEKMGKKEGATKENDAYYQFSEKEKLSIDNMRRFASLYGFNPNLGGSEIKYGNATYIVVGIRRHNFMLKNTNNNQVYDARITLIIDHLKRVNSELLDKKPKKSTKISLEQPKLKK